MALVAKVYDASYTTLLRTLTLTDNLACLPQLNQAGSGAFRLPLTAPDHAATLALEQAACTYGNVVRFEDNGVPVFAMLVRGKQVVRADSQEEAGQGITVTGPGHLAQWSRAVWYPEGGVPDDGFSVPVPYDTRHLTFASGDFDDSGWAAVDTADQTTVEQFGPLNWPSTTTKKIRPGGSPVAPTPPEVFGVRRVITLAEPDRTYRWYYTGDDGAETYFNGVRVASETRPAMWQTTRYVDLRLRSGPLTIGVQGTNLDFPLPNYSWVMGALYLLGTDGTLQSLVVETDSSWVGQQFGTSPPGFTSGAQAGLFLAEAQTRGALLNWSLGCSDTLDSDGALWTVAPASSYQIGLDGLSFLAKLGEAYCDVMADPASCTLNLWNKGTHGGASGVTATPGVNVGSFVNQGQG